MLSTTTNPTSERSTALLSSEDVEFVQQTKSLDSFLEEAYQNKTGGTKWGYWFLMGSLGIANASDASEILCLSYILTDESFRQTILHHTAWRGSLLASTVYFGMFLGGLLVGTLSDFPGVRGRRGRGRHSMLLAALWCNSIAAVLSAIAQNVYQLALLRAIAGLGIGASIPPLFTLTTEYAPPSQRGFFVTYVASFWMVGAIYVSLVGWLLLGYWSVSWRIFTVTCAFPTTLGAILVQFLVKESPRYLAVHGRYDEALPIIHWLGRSMKCHHNDNNDEPVMTLQDLQSLYTVSNNNNNNNNANTTSHTNLDRRCSGLSKFFRTTKDLYRGDLVRTTIPLQIVWFALSFGSYGILTWINTLFELVRLENPYFNAVLFALANLPGNIVTALFMDRLGRHRMLLVSAMGAALSLLGFALEANKRHDAINDKKEDRVSTTINVVVASCFFQACIAMAWNTIDTLSSEIFLTRVRSTGMGLCGASGRVGALVAQIVNGFLLQQPVLLLILASTFLLLSGVTPYALPPTTTTTSRHSNGGGSYQPLQDDQIDENTVFNNDGTILQLDVVEVVE